VSGAVLEPVFAVRDDHIGKTETGKLPALSTAAIAVPRSKRRASPLGLVPLISKRNCCFPLASDTQVRALR
jgi:hypothetical protein